MEYIKEQIGGDTPYESYIISEFNDTKQHGKYRDIARFYDEDEADEYIEFLINKNNQNEKNSINNSSSSFN
jgi:imidazole glycerol phosphate synthase subunit HisF